MQYRLADNKKPCSEALAMTTRAERTRALHRIEKTIGHRFRRPALLKEAFTHASLRAVGETVDNTRLAFVGDAVVDLYAANKVYRESRDGAAGDLTDMRQALVNNARLAQVATDLGFLEHLRVGPSIKDARRHRSHFRATLFEAVIGAVFLDAGYEKAVRVINRLLAKSP